MKKNTAFNQQGMKIKTKIKKGRSLHNYSIKKKLKEKKKEKQKTFLKKNISKQV